MDTTVFSPECFAQMKQSPNALGNPTAIESMSVAFLEPLLHDSVDKIMMSTTEENPSDEENPSAEANTLVHITQDELHAADSENVNIETITTISGAVENVPVPIIPDPLPATVTVNVNRDDVRMDFDHWNVKGREEKDKMTEYIFKTVKQQVEQADDAVFKNKDCFFRRRDLDEDFRIDQTPFSTTIISNSEKARYDILRRKQNKDMEELADLQKRIDRLLAYELRHAGTEIR
ncbi:hypothetical protein DAPPUDRAFT_318731 [Daphnia pulex]|uniref:Uncharacterized protein n=1 Tax=Daphnia pulex TaxID=6669 RepID=E9GK60_DAPPU|nr:hypothetical protein DAPPUDRAFT_318731 [Daphnia pulex]|eukprot:EFX80127.1 hypothetical protein DAPPUDRAFT_318731 [Daphnia pulex]